MEVYLLDKSFETINIIDKCITLEVTKRFFSPGEFKLVLDEKVPMSSAYALYEPVSKSCFLIEGYEESDGKITLSGRSLEALLEKRVLDGMGRYSGGAEKAVRFAFEKCTSGERNLSGMILGDEAGITGDGYFKTDYRNLSEFVYATLRPFGATYRVELSGNVPVLKVVTGKDRRRDQTRYPPAVFSESMDNAKDVRLKADLTEHRNTAYVLGGDGRSVTVVLDDSPFDRREIFVSGRDISPDDFNSDSEYLKALKSRGTETLAKYGGGVTYTGTVTGGLRLGADYSLGDICEIDTVSGLTFYERVTEVKYVFTGGEVTAAPYFGERGKSLSELARENSHQIP